ncbi:MAG TPA: enoyl-CoA hydratase-related protein [Candidatus Thermoplasmatota archaeon]|nr:enoyl-CoA hydratase-related protein [Candidatus Thermoplasmatota archaeon]
MTPDSVQVTRDGPVALLRFARPDRYNAFDLAAIRALGEAVDKAVADPTVRCLLITGEGRAFCAGGDVAEMAEKGEKAFEHFRDLTEHHHPLVRTLSTCPKPVVVAVNGVAAGGGVGIALAGDYRLGGASAKFRAAYLRLGVSPDGGATYLLPRLAGLAAAQRFFYRNEALAAEEALRLGLLHEVVPDAELPARALAVAREMAALPLQAFARTKALLSTTLGSPDQLQDHLDAERHLISECATGPEYREGARAFAEKREPRFLP